jgi:hypothetical protein
MYKNWIDELREDYYEEYGKDIDNLIKDVKNNQPDDLLEKIKNVGLKDFKYSSNHHEWHLEFEDGSYFSFVVYDI